MKGTSDIVIDIVRLVTFIEAEQTCEDFLTMVHIMEECLISHPEIQTVIGNMAVKFINNGNGTWDDRLIELLPTEVINVPEDWEEELEIN